MRTNQYKYSNITTVLLYIRVYSSVIMVVIIISPPQNKSVCKVRNSCNGSEFSCGPRGDGSSPCAAASRYIHMCRTLVRTDMATSQPLINL